MEKEELLRAIEEEKQNGFNNAERQLELIKMAATRGDIQLLEVLSTSSFISQIKQKIKDKIKFSILLSAAQSASIETMEYLLLLGIDINLLSPYQENVFHIALSSHHTTIEFLEYLSQKGVDVHKTTKFSHSSITFAVVNHTNERSLMLLKYLVSLGINAHQKRNTSENIFLLAAKQNRTIEYFEYLESLSIDIHCIDLFGSNAILNYMQNLDKCINLETLKYLVSLGINIHQINKKDEGLFIMALRSGDIEAIKYVKTLGIDLNHVHFPPLIYVMEFLNPKLFKYVNENFDNQIFNHYQSYSNLDYKEFKNVHCYILHQLIRSFRTSYNFANDKDKFNSLDYFLGISKGYINYPETQTFNILIQKLNRTIPLPILWKLVKYFIDKGSNLLHQSKEGSVLMSLESNSIILVGSKLDNYSDVGKYIVVRSLENFLFINIHGVESSRNGSVYEDIWKKEFLFNVLSFPPILQIQSPRGAMLCLPNPSTSFCRKTL